MTRFPYPPFFFILFQGYRLAYRRHHEQARRTEEDVREVKLGDPEVTTYEIRGLREFTRYLVSVQVVNPEGLGPASTVEVSTDEGGEEYRYKYQTQGMPIKKNYCMSQYCISIIKKMTFAILFLLQCIF